MSHALALFFHAHYFSEALLSIAM